MSTHPPTEATKTKAASVLPPRYEKPVIDSVLASASPASANHTSPPTTTTVRF